MSPEGAIGPVPEGCISAHLQYTVCTAVVMSDQQQYISSPFACFSFSLYWSSWPISVPLYYLLSSFLKPFKSYFRHLNKAMRLYVMMGLTAEVTDFPPQLLSLFNLILITNKSFHRQENLSFIWASIGIQVTFRWSTLESTLEQKTL